MSGAELFPQPGLHAVDRNELTSIRQTAGQRHAGSSLDVDAPPLLLFTCVWRVTGRWSLEFTQGHIILMHPHFLLCEKSLRDFLQKFGPERSALRKGTWSTNALKARAPSSLPA